MKYHKVRIGDLEHVEKEHPLIAAQGAEFVMPALAPTSDDDPDFPILYYGAEDGELACYFRSFPDTLRLGTQDVPMALAGNLMTLPAFRRRGLAQALTEQQLEECDRAGRVWSGVFSAEAAIRLYEKLAITIVGKAPRMCFVRNVSPFLAHHMPGVAARALGLGGKLAATGLDRVLRFRQPWRKAVHLTEISPEDLGRLLTAHTPDTQNLARFDTDADWVLRRRAVRDVDRVLLVSTPDTSSPIGYFLARQRPNVKRPIREKYYGVDSMSIMHFDLLQDHTEGYEILLAGALNHFFASSADLFDMVTSQDAMLAAARRAGLFPLGEGMSFKFMEPTSLKGVLPTGLQDFHLTHYAGDAFAFE